MYFRILPSAIADTPKARAAKLVGSGIGSGVIGGIEGLEVLLPPPPAKSAAAPPNAAATGTMEPIEWDDEVTAATGTDETISIAGTICDTAFDAVSDVIVSVAGAAMTVGVTDAADAMSALGALGGATNGPTARLP